MNAEHFQPLSEEEVERRLAHFNEELKRSDLERFASRHQCAIPTSIVTLYANHELLTQRHFLTQCGVVVRWFCPINDDTFIHTHADGNRYAIFACADDGESFCFPLGDDANDCQIRVLWESGELDTIDLTADELSIPPTSQTGG